MDGMRLRLASVLEWGIAAAFLAATVAVGSLILHGVRSPVGPVGISAAGMPPPVAAIPPAVPAGAVAVPSLPFQDGKEVRVGDTASSVTRTLGRAAESGREESDRGRLGQRLTRFYEYSGFRFIVVYEPFERNGEPRVSGIFLP